MNYKGFITTLMAAAIAITGLTAAPAKADNTAEIIAGVAALAIIGAAIAEASNNDPVYVTRNRYYGHNARPVYRHHSYNNYYYAPRKKHRIRNHRAKHRYYHHRRSHIHGAP